MISRKIFNASLEADMLSADEERELGFAARAGDVKARDRLVLAHMRLAVAFANKYRGYCMVDVDDLVQEGMLGLMHAVEGFDPDGGARFATFSMFWVREKIQSAAMRGASPVRIGTTTRQRLIFFRLRRYFEALRSTHPDISENALTSAAAEHFGTTQEEISRIAFAVGQGAYSLDVPLADGTGDTHGDNIPDDRANPEEIVMERHDGALRIGRLRAAVASLEERDQQIITRRRLREKAQTLAEVGRELGISNERTRQLEVRAVKRLAAALEVVT